MSREAYLRFDLTILGFVNSMPPVALALAAKERRLKMELGPAQGPACTIDKNLDARIRLNSELQLAV